MTGNYRKETPNVPTRLPKVVETDVVKWYSLTFRWSDDANANASYRAMYVAIDVSGIRAASYLLTN